MIKKFRTTDLETATHLFYDKGLHFTLDSTNPNKIAFVFDNKDGIAEMYAGIWTIRRKEMLDIVMDERRRKLDAQPTT